MHDSFAAPPTSVATAPPPDQSAVESGRTVTRMPVAAITVRPQVRTQFDAEALDELAASIRTVGILHPLLIRREGQEMVLVDGERRLRAAILAGLIEVPVLLIDPGSGPGPMIQSQLVANLHRRDLNPMELARGLAELRNATGWTATELASQVGLSLASVSRSLALLDLVDSVQTKVESGQLAASTALKLRKAVPERQATLASGAAGLSRDHVERLVRGRRRVNNPRRGARPLLAVGPLRVHVGSKASPSDVVVALQQLSDLARALSLISPDLTPFLEALRAELKPSSDVPSPNVSSVVAIER